MSGICPGWVPSQTWPPIKNNEQTIGFTMFFANNNETPLVLQWFLYKNMKNHWFDCVFHDFLVKPMSGMEAFPDISQT
jgi:hypothetical protein